MTQPSRSTAPPQHAAPGDFAREFRRGVSTAVDVEAVRRAARTIAGCLGFTLADTEKVALAAAELAMNLVRYARSGEIVIGPVGGQRDRGVRIESHDRGPGIADVERAMADGYSTGGGLGSGLPAVRRLMDEFELTTSPAGTTICTCKRLPAASDTSATAAPHAPHAPRR